MTKAASSNQTTQFRFRQESLWGYFLAIPTWFAAATLFILMSMTFLDVILRSLFSNPIESATELTRLFMAIIVFSSLPMVSWKGENIAVDLLDPIMSDKIVHWRNILFDLITGIVLIWPTIRVWQLAERSRKYGDVTEYLNLPQHYTGWFIAIFTGITAMAFIARALVCIFQGKQEQGQ